MPEPQPIGEPQDDASMRLLIALHGALSAASPLDAVLDAAMGVVLDAFEADRAWLLHPCVIGAGSFEIPAERTTPRYPGARAMGMKRVPAGSDSAELTPLVLDSTGPVVFHDTAGHPIAQAARAFGVRSELELVLRPTVGAPWILGLHQCSHPRVWTPAELDRFVLAGRTIEQALSRTLSERERFAHERERARLESVGVLAAGLAHEFNNLLTTITMSAELGQTGTPDEMRAALGQTADQARRGGEICSQLLAYAGHGMRVHSRVNVNTLVSELAPHQALPLCLADGAPCVQGDPGQLRRAILSMVENAAEATATGGTIQVSTRVSPPWVVVRVQDTGMAPEVRERAFEPFFSTKFAGRGLGLATVQGVARSHGGSVNLQTRTDAGTTIELTLPLCDPTGEHVPRELNQQPVLITDRAPVLVADDDPQLQTMLRRVLERAGYPVITANDGEEAVRYVLNLPAGRFDALVMDLTMPKLGGLEAMRQIHAHRPEMPTVLLSGYSRDRVGVLPDHVRFLAKPFRPKALVDALGGLLSP